MSTYDVVGSTMRGAGVASTSSSADPDFRAGRRRVVRLVLILLLALVSPLSLRPSGHGAEEPDVVAFGPDFFLDVVVPEAPDVAGTLPIHVNTRVERWLRHFQSRGREEFALWMERSGVYAPMIREKLASRGLPEELFYLAMLESGLSPRAISPDSAVGIWQFMGPTALEYGLRVDEYVDERRDPVRATDAAVAYLETLHARFGSWYLAAAAYNAGPNRVESLLQIHLEGETVARGRLGEKDLYWEVLEHLPSETREYVPRLIAATILAEEARAYGFAASEARPRPYDEVYVPGGTPLNAVARATGAEPSELRALNPHLLAGIVPPGALYGVRVPPGEGPAVVNALAEAGARRRQLAD